ncbi:transporter substrate-binding domain-containing protein [Bradyrhizobium sp. PMVTL-01]|uniref:transporter substrate-binding domain-containing protein n=1 Tax=Bradyrhizobium sp. PMVTL-01 TaxID=3434999 RepID=UPI003F71CE7A
MLFKIADRLLMRGLTVVSLFAGTAYAQNSPKVITAGDVTTYPPYAYKDLKTGEFTGFDRDLFEAMAKKIGATVKWEFFSYTDLASFAPLKTGRVDIYGGGAMQGHPARRAQGVSFIDFVYEPYVFYVLKANAGLIETPDALCGRRVATFRGYTGTTAVVNKWNEEVCKKAGKPSLVHVEIDGGTPTAKLELKQGRVDAAIGGAGAIAYSNEYEGGNYLTVPRPLSKNMYGMGFPNEKKELGESLHKALNELIADGTYVQLLKKWHLPIEDSHIGKATINNAPEPEKS